MRKITRKEFNKLRVKKRPYKTQFERDLIHNLRQCKVYEGLFIEKEEYIRKTRFYQFIRDIVRKDRLNMKFETKSLGDGSGWIVLRIK
jgi:hypothetical protein